MNTTYNESKKTLDKIRQEYGCKGDIIFRTAIQYVVEHGQYKFYNKKWVAKQYKIIDKKHNKAKKEGRTLWIERGFEKALIECAVEIAKACNAYDFLMYVQKEIWLGGDSVIDYKRAIRLLQNCINYTIEESCETAVALEKVDEMGFDDNELVELGFEYMLDIEEDN